MSIKQEFKDFIMRGNVIDLAVGMVVGTAFSGIVKSLVDDVIMPPIGLLIGGVDFSNLFLTLKNGANAPESGYASLEAAKAAGAVTLNIGGIYQYRYQFFNCSQCHIYGCEIIEFIEEKRKGS